MACPPALLSSLNKTLTRNENRLTVTLEVGTKGKLSPRLVITDLEMLDWLSTIGYNVNKVLNSGYIDNLSYTGNRPTWEFDIETYPPGAPEDAQALRPSPPKRLKRRRSPRVPVVTAPPAPSEPVKEAKEDPSEKPGSYADEFFEVEASAG